MCDKLNHNVRFVSQHHFHSFPARPPIRWTMCCQTCILDFHSVFFEIVFDTIFHNEFGSSEEILLAGGSGWTEMMAR